MNTVYSLSAPFLFLEYLRSFSDEEDMNDVTVYPMKIRINPNNTKNIDALLKKFIYLPDFPEIYGRYISFNLILQMPPVSR